MKSLKESAQQLLKLWQGADLRARVVFSVAVVASVLATAWVGVWSSRPQYVPLARDLPAEQASRIKSQLDAQGIPNQLNFDASSVLVPKSKWNVARLAVQDQLGPLPDEPPAFESSPWSDPRTVHRQMLHRQELQLAQTIRTWQGIADVKVHLAKPEPSVFVRDQSPATASVVLQLKPGGGFTPDQASAIASMVAGAVEGLDPQHVTVMDTQGRVLASGGDALSGVSHQLAYKRALEADLAAKAQSMLAATLGAGRAMVRVVADVDFTSTVRTDRIYDPERKVRTKETVLSWQSSGASSIALGPAGTSSNFSATGASTSTAEPSSSKGEQLVTEFENGVTESRVEEAPGQLTRLTVAATVDLSGTNGTSGEGAPALTKADVEALIKQTVGFDESRGDQIHVVTAPLLGTQVVENRLTVMDRWKLYENLARDVSLGIAALAALLIALLILRRLRLPSLPPSAGQVDLPHRDQMMAQLAQRARENPDALRTVIAAWLNESDGSRYEEARPRKAA